MSHLAFDRRTLLARGVAAISALGVPGNWAFAVEGGADWSCPVLGDLHFDRLEHHDHEWLAREHPGDVSQVQNYSRITREMTPRLFANVHDDLATLEKSRTTVPFVLQLGDLLEGLCGSPELAARHAQEGIEYFQAAKLSAPLVMTKGNHDITGPGAADVYRQQLLPFLATSNRADIRDAKFTRQAADTLVVFYDAYDSMSLDWFAKTLEDRKPRRLIVAIHPPVVPYNARSTWHIYSSPRQAAQRKQFLDLLGQHQALVLCGHLHKYSLLVRRTDTGRFVQLALSSVAANSDGRPRDERSGVDDYRPDLVDLEPRHAPESIEARRALLAAERPFIEHYEYADTWGRAVLHSRDSKLAADVYRGFEPMPWKRLDFSKWL